LISELSTVGHLYGRVWPSCYDVAVKPQVLEDVAPAELISCSHCLVQLAISNENVMTTLDEISDEVREIAEFFVNYHELDGSKFQILDVRGPKEARRRIEKCRTADNAN
jgi:hypothetical protein